MPLAQAEGFWKPPTIYDIIGLAGFVVGIGSIWLAWWLAKRDISRRVDEAAERASRAARDEVRRLVRTMLRTGVADILRSLELARPACTGRQWTRALDLCQLAVGQLARVRGQSATEPTAVAILAGVSARIEVLVEVLRGQPKVGTGVLPGEAARELDGVIAALNEFEGRITAAGPGV